MCRLLQRQQLDSRRPPDALTESQHLAFTQPCPVYPARRATDRPRLAPGQPVCFGVVRAPGFTDPIQVQEVLNGLSVADPEGDAPGQLVPGRCDQPTCTVTLVLKSGSRFEYAWITYRD